jgi:feruloyl esterase
MSDRRVQLSRALRVPRLALLAIFLGSSAVLAATPCESLSSLNLLHTAITMAAKVEAGEFTLPTDGRGRGDLFATLPAFCRVAGVIKPAADSSIKFEVWMPLEQCNERFHGVGNGGLAGSVSYQGLAQALAEGYATASTDTGHESPTSSTSDALWAMGHPEKVIDFGYRAVHEMTEKGKAITTAFYGAAPKYSYWVGCSEGGRQAMGEAQRYPDDYDGIVAGAPVFGFTHTQTRGIQAAKLLLENTAGFIPARKYRMVHEAVLVQCDAADGVKDGVILHPPACIFDPASLLCKDGDKPDCLTAAQVKQLNALYNGVRNPRTGERIAFGNARGVELQVAKYKGSGSTDDAANFVCAMPSTDSAKSGK